MTKVMYVDTVITVFIFLFLIFGYFFYARRGAYLIMFIMLKTFSGASRHNASQKIFKIQATMQLPPHQRWKSDGRKKLFLHPHIPS